MCSDSLCKDGQYFFDIQKSFLVQENYGWSGSKVSFSTVACASRVWYPISVERNAFIRLSPRLILIQSIAINQQILLNQSINKYIQSYGFCTRGAYKEMGLGEGKVSLALPYHSFLPGSGGGGITLMAFPLNTPLIRTIIINNTFLK